MITKNMKTYWALFLWQIKWINLNIYLNWVWNANKNADFSFFFEIFFRNDNNDKEKVAVQMRFICDPPYLYKGTEKKTEMYEQRPKFWDSSTCEFHIYFIWLWYTPIWCTENGIYYSIILYCCFVDIYIRVYYLINV